MSGFVMPSARTDVGMIPVRCYQVMLETTTRSIQVTTLTHRQVAFDLAQVVDRQPTKSMQEIFGYDNDIGLRVSVITLVHGQPVQRDVAKVFESQGSEVLQCSQPCVTSYAGSVTSDASGLGSVSASRLGS